MLLLISAVGFSTAGLFVRALALDPITTVFWRNLLGAAMLVPVAAGRSETVPAQHMRRAAAIVALTALGSVCYVAAFASTSVAHVVIIYATAPMLTTGLAWLMLGERASRRSVQASGLALTGVALTILDDDVGSTSLGGDGLALAMTIALSLVAVLSRGRDLAPLRLACVSSLVAALAMVPLGPAWTVGAGPCAMLAAFGLVTTAVALPCYLAGLRSVPAGQALLISTLDLPLAPLWVWFAFGERPSVSALVGGAIVGTAVLWDVIGPMRSCPDAKEPPQGGSPGC